MYHDVVRNDSKLQSRMSHDLELERKNLYICIYDFDFSFRFYLVCWLSVPTFLAFLRAVDDFFSFSF